VLIVNAIGLRARAGDQDYMNTSSIYNIAISGTFDVENYGDLMFPIMAEHELTRRLGSVQLTRYSYLAKVAHSWPYDVTPLSGLNGELGNHTGLLIGGGHLIRFDKGVAKGYYPSDGETHHPTGYWLTPALAAANTGVPVFWNGPSASLDTPAWGAPLLRAALAMSEYVSVRDEPTAAELRRIGYSGQCSIIPDTVFGLPDLLPLEDACTRAAPLLEQAGITGPYIVVQAKSELASIAQALAAHPDTQHLQILVVAIGPILGEHPSLITDAVPAAKSLSFWPAPLDIAALIAASAGTVAISLHLTITSLCYGLPVLRYSRTRLTKYEFIEASKNVFLHEGGDEPLPPEYVAHLTLRKPCSIAQQAKSALDAHWEHIARSLIDQHERRKEPAHKDFLKVWNMAMRQAEALAEEGVRATSALRAHIATLEATVAGQDQALNAVTQERDQGHKSYELLIAKQAQLETRISEEAQGHKAEVKALMGELAMLKQSLADLLEGNKALLVRHDQAQESFRAIQRTFQQSEHELRDRQHKLDAENLAQQETLSAQKLLNADMLQALQAATSAMDQLKQSERRELDDMRQMIAERDARIQGLLGSRSWRLTMPLRVGTSMARSVKNRVLPQRAKLQSETVVAAYAAPLQLQAPALTELGQEQSALVELTEPSPPLDMLAQCAPPQIRSEPFNEEFYVENYPDVAASGMDPYQHYIEFGKAEDRLGVPPPLMLSENADATHPGRDYVLVVCHDATRTGAPILGWNICRELGKRYNVIALLLGDGEISEYFLNDCAVVAGPYDRSVRTPKAIGRTIAGLNERYKLAFSIVNSIASRSVLRPLAEQYVPSVLLVHEFSKFHCYPDEIVDTLGWAGEVVFPAKIVQSNASLERTLPAIRRSHIIAQGQSAIPAAKVEESAAALEQMHRERSELIKQVLAEGSGAEKPFIVLGAGTIEYRKGVDLFIAAATKLKAMAADRKILMVWVGRTYETPVHTQYRAFLEDQIHTSDLQDRLIMLDETPHLDALYELADLFFVSARLDPLPNVAIDAMTLGTPLICFENATGVSEILSSNETTQECVLPYLNVQAAAQFILDISASPEMQRQIAQACQLIATQTFALPEYVKKLESLALNATTATYQRRADELALTASADFVTDFYRARRAQEPEEQAPRTYLKQSQSRIYIRKPAPGFNPAAYADHAGLSSSDPDPYLHWLQAGKPQGAWQEEILDLIHADVEPITKLRIGVHIHAYYPDLLASILDRMEINQLECDYLISVPNAKAHEEAMHVLAERKYKDRCLVRQTENRGRDIGPFFTGFAKELATYDIVGHFHTKKSPHVTLSNLVPDWIEFLLENMVGGKYRAADAIITAFSKDKQLGLVFADDPHLIGWDKNRRFAATLAEKMGMPPLTDGFFPFPVGTMFWARPEALAPVFDLALEWSDYPSEPLPIDGSMLHALERLLPGVARHAGFAHCSTYAGITR
jgi:glycosyltransferase involved in cell wall biosynthesis